MQIPRSARELTADWLSAALRSHDPNRRRVESFDIDLFSGEQGMTGQLARLHLRYQREPGSMPTTVIAKFSAPDPVVRTLISALGHYEREVGFYELLSSRTPVPIPRCYYSRLEDHDGSAILILADLGGLRNGNSIAGCSVDDVARVLVSLARLHARWWL